MCTTTRILYTCHHVFYKQLSAWMLHGLLLDQKGEFFIEKIELSQSSEVEQREVDEEAPTAGPFSATEKATSEFRINGQLAPSYLPQTVLEKILFIGEAVQIFQTLHASGAHPPLASFSVSSGYQLRADLMKFSWMLTVLQNQPILQLRDFENKIEYIRNVVAQHLWRLLVEESNLVGHLHVMKDIFLLGRGELFLSFIDMADILMKQSPTSTTQHDINVAFRQAMIKIAMDHEELAKQFELTLSLPPVQSSGVSLKSKMTNSWKYVGMSHKVSWPLHVVLTPATLEKYSALFHFLLSLRRAQAYLQQCWATLMTIRTGAHCLQAVWQLRTHMGFLIDNLQYYVQVDVLETQFSQLLNRIKSTHDFEAVKVAHSDFVKTLQSQLFFTEP
ncbi:Gamma-tubulin complex component 4 [Geodia barretti]|nr:Gamma-tubulin complex component 4 [Geodia barretti]